MEHRCGKYLVTNCRCDVYAFNLRRLTCRPSMIDVSTFEDRWSMCRPSMIDVSTFEDRCRPSEIDVSTFENRWLMCRSSKMDVSTFEHRWSMWNYAAILAKNIDTIVVYMRITPRVCTSVLSLYLQPPEWLFFHFMWKKGAWVGC